jgi:putative flippase GtrA
MSPPAPEVPVTSSGALSCEMARFALIGLVATSAHYLVAIGAVQYINVYGANLAGYLTAVTISYFGHQRFSFQLSAREISHRSQFPRFILASLGGLALSYLVLAVMEDGLGSPHWLSLAAAVCFVPIYTFLVNKLCVFRAEVQP